MRRYIFFFAAIVTIFVLVIGSCKSTKDVTVKNDTIQEESRGDYRIMFYNCENFFDTYDDSLKRDDDFTPDGVKHWTQRKYEEKLGHLSRVITSVGGWQPPELVGLCEVENQFVLEQLTKESPLKVFNYKIIHFESPDRRGIDVALLYIPSKFKPIVERKIPVVFPENMGKPTRDILYVVGLTTHKDTLHIFVNHWPSRWGGMLETEPKRMFVANLLRTKVDSIFDENPDAKIIIMGDLNDFPTNKSCLETLHPSHDFDNIKHNEIYNLAYYLQEEKGKFSHRYHGEAGILDQMMVSGALLDTSSTIYMTKDDAHIYSAPFLLEKDPDYGGYKTNRTYIGMKYHGGYSDHLPPYIDLYYKKNKK